MPADSEQPPPRTSRHAPPAPHTLPVIGITGGIGAGKSTVAAAFAAEGCFVCDSDALGAQALQDPAVITQLRAWWGDRIFDADGRVDRSRLAHVVFASPESRGAGSVDERPHTTERKRLESLVHPWIEARRAELFAAPPAGTKALVIDAPLLLEAGLDAQCDAIVFVDTPLEARRARVLAGRKWDSAEHSRREAAQWPLDRKRSCADHVLHNDDGSDALRAQVRQVLGAVLAAHGGAHR